MKLHGGSCDFAHADAWGHPLQPAMWFLPRKPVLGEGPAAAWKDMQPIRCSPKGKRLLPVSSVGPGHDLARVARTPDEPPCPVGIKPHPQVKQLCWAFLAAWLEKREFPFLRWRGTPSFKQ